MEASKSYSHNTLRSSQHTVRTREQSHHIAQCLCSRDLGGWLAGWQEKTVFCASRKNKHCCISNIWNYYQPKRRGFSTRSSIRTVIAYAIPLSLFSTSGGKHLRFACRIVPIMGHSIGNCRGTTGRPSDLAARLSHGRRAPSNTRAKHPPWGPNPRARRASDGFSTKQSAWLLFVSHSLVDSSPSSRSQTLTMSTPGVEPGLSRPQRDVLTTRRCGR